MYEGEIFRMRNSIELLNSEVVSIMNRFDTTDSLANDLDSIEMKLSEAHRSVNELIEKKPHPKSARKLS